MLLDESGKYDNQSIELTGAEAVSWNEIAGVISQITGETITYVSPADEEFKTTLTQAGVPVEIVTLSGGFAKATREGEFEQVTTHLENLLGHKPVSVADYLQTVYSK